MICPACGYSMDSFDKECPRCHGKGIPQPTGNQTLPLAPQPSTPAPQHQPQMPPQASQPQPQPQVVVKQSSGFSSGLGTGAGAGVGCCCLAPLLIIGFFAFLSALGQTVGKVEETALEPVVQNTAVRLGPSFTEADAKMDSRISTWTEAQKQAYWQSVEGTQITWGGEVLGVTLDNGGRLNVKCNPKSYGSDVSVALDGTQLDKLPLINKGQHVTFQGILKGHGVGGYTIENGRVVGL